MVVKVTISYETNFETAAERKEKELVTVTQVMKHHH